MKWPVVVLLLSMCVMGCGGTSGAPATRSRLSSETATTRKTLSVTSSGHYLNDGDAEKVNDHDGDNGPGNHDDSDADSLEEYEEANDNGKYHDKDDDAVLNWGRSVSGTDRRAITMLVKRYYAAASAGDGASACRMMLQTFARSLPEDYGQASGPSYLRGGKTCQAVMSLLFRYRHRALAGPIAVTGVRSEGVEARVFVGSESLPASVIPLQHTKGAWRIVSMIGGPLP